MHAVMLPAFLHFIALLHDDDMVHTQTFVHSIALKQLSYAAYSAHSVLVWGWGGYSSRGQRKSYPETEGTQNFSMNAVSMNAGGPGR